MSSGVWAAFGTIGQTVIGRSISTNFAANAGFWGDGGMILDVEGRVAARVPDEFALQQSFPNPFNPRTTVAFSVPRVAHVRL